VTGTDTGVGKTFVAAGLVRLFVDRGRSVFVMKPVETGCVGGRAADAEMLAAAARRETVVPYTFEEPLAPLVAARRTGCRIDVDRIVGVARDLSSRQEIVVVEGAGGLSVPLTEDCDMAGLAGRLRLPLLVVARPDLGTLNHTFLTVRYARSMGLLVIGVVLSGVRPEGATVAEQTNPGLIEEMCDVPVLGRVPHIDFDGTPEAAAAAVADGVDLDGILALVEEIGGPA
jgi:dethiobiotin synthetase